MKELFASIIVDITVKSLNKPFVYVVPDNIKDKIKVGDKVIFPFGNANVEREGFVFELFL